VSIYLVELSRCDLTSLYLGSGRKMRPLRARQTDTSLVDKETVRKPGSSRPLSSGGARTVARAFEHEEPASARMGHKEGENSP
jgi:hypothetical protein